MMLRMPLLFWLIVLLQARSWLLLLVDRATHHTGYHLLQWVYPDKQILVYGLYLAIPAVALCMLSVYRQRWPRLWQSGYWLLLLMMFATFTLHGLAIWRCADFPALTDILLALLDAVALGYWLLSRALRGCFEKKSP
jgi:hypothetical protein